LNGTTIGLDEVGLKSRMAAFEQFMSAMEGELLMGIATDRDEVISENWLSEKRNAPANHSASSNTNEINFITRMN
jgi:hypothetical protein